MKELEEVTELLRAAGLEGSVLSEAMDAVMTYGHERYCEGWDNAGGGY